MDVGTAIVANRSGGAGQVSALSSDHLLKELTSLAITDGKLRATLEHERNKRRVDKEVQSRKVQRRLVSMPWRAGVSPFLTRVDFHRFRRKPSSGWFPLGVLPRRAAK